MENEQGNDVIENGLNYMMEGLNFDAEEKLRQMLE